MANGAGKPLMLPGFDPVAYFTHGQAQRGQPQVGGFCASGAAEGYGQLAPGYRRQVPRPVVQPFLALAAATSLASSSPLL